MYDNLANKFEKLDYEDEISRIKKLNISIVMNLLNGTHANAFVTL